ncbi:hypothetical protein HK105_202112 [Polyrhizophydium stewartii]|uniref:Uncharacterized protein n=1 Tax=Polyrhizophydium stewartii TaxID=2732419 RepID=A0ABR4NFA0_9FUNG
MGQSLATPRPTAHHAAGAKQGAGAGRSAGCASSSDPPPLEPLSDGDGSASNSDDKGTARAPRRRAARSAGPRGGVSLAARCGSAAAAAGAAFGSDTALATRPARGAVEVVVVDSALTAPLDLGSAPRSEASDTQSAVTDDGDTQYTTTDDDSSFGDDVAETASQARQEQRPLSLFSFWAEHSAEAGIPSPTLSTRPAGRGAPWNRKLLRPRRRLVPRMPTLSLTPNAGDLASGSGAATPVLDTPRLSRATVSQEPPATQPSAPPAPGPAAFALAAGQPLSQAAIALSIASPLQPMLTPVRTSPPVAPLHRPTAAGKTTESASNKNELLHGLAAKPQLSSPPPSAVMANEAAVEAAFAAVLERFSAAAKMTPSPSISKASEAAIDGKDPTSKSPSTPAEAPAELPQQASDPVRQPASAAVVIPAALPLAESVTLSPTKPTAPSPSMPSAVPPTKPADLSSVKRSAAPPTKTPTQVALPIAPASASSAPEPAPAKELAQPGASDRNVQEMQEASVKQAPVVTAPEPVSAASLLEPQVASTAPAAAPQPSPEPEDASKSAKVDAELAEQQRLARLHQKRVRRLRRYREAVEEGKMVCFSCEYDLVFRQPRARRDGVAGLVPIVSAEMIVCPIDEPAPAAVTASSHKTSQPETAAGTAPAAPAAAANASATPAKTPAAATSAARVPATNARAASKASATTSKAPAATAKAQAAQPQPSAKPRRGWRQPRKATTVKHMPVPVPVPASTAAAAEPASGTRAGTRPTTRAKPQ